MCCYICFSASGAWRQTARWHVQGCVLRVVDYVFYPIEDGALRKVRLERLRSVLTEERELCGDISREPAGHHRKGTP